MPRTLRSHRTCIEAMIVVLGFGAALLPQGSLAAEEAGDQTLRSRFEYLSESGNSNCSRQFMDSIATMPGITRLRGSCCSPVDEHRYDEQVKGLKKYRDLTMIPADPYDIPAGLAQEHMPHYSVTLTAQEQAAYDYAMENSNEKGPCCCRCWRWPVFGGLAKYLIREHGFTGEQVAKIWDLSDGCGGSGEHVH